MSIKNKLLLSFLSISAAIGLLAGLAFYHNINQAEHIALHEAESVARTVALIASEIVHPAGPPHTPGAQRKLQELVMRLKNLHGRDIVIVGKDKVILADAVPEEVGTRFLHDLHGEVDLTIADGRVRTFSETSVAYPGGIMQMVIPVKSVSGTVHDAVILEYTPLYTEMRDLAVHDARRFFLFYLAALGGSLAAGYLLYRNVVVPVRRIRQAAHRVASGDLDTRLVATGKDEFASLTESFNLMTEELKRSRGSFLRSQERLEQEIAVRKQAESGLKEALDRVSAEKSKTDAVLQGLGVGIIIQDLDYRVFYENELQKRTSGDHVGEFCYKAYEQKDAICEDCPMVASLRDGGVHRTERRVASPQGEIFAELVSTPLRDAAGKIIGGIKMVRDITERKRSEQELHSYRTRLEELVTKRTEELSLVNDQLRQAQKMEAVGQLAGGIAHDFNNILSAIINCATILQMELPEEDPVTSYVDQILASSERAASLTKSLLAFSRKQIIRPRLIDVNEVVSRMDRLLTRVIGEDIELATRLTDRDLTIMADASQLEQVLMNLMTNARDAMPEGGRVTIHSEQITLDDQFIRTHGYGTPGPYALISVADTGAGMEEPVRKKIFEPFFTTKEVGKGTGLGLSIVYGIIKQHHGYINVYSEPGKGTVFTIYLPMISSPAGREEVSTEAPLPGGNETILLAEDDETLRMLARQLLERFGYRVIEAENGEDAVRRYGNMKESIDLLVFDMVMPKMNGREAYEAIRQVNPGIRALFVSGYATEIIRKTEIGGPEPDIIQKPLVPGEFLTRIRSALDLQVRKDG